MLENLFRLLCRKIRAQNGFDPTQISFPKLVPWTARGLVFKVKDAKD